MNECNEWSDAMEKHCWAEIDLTALQHNLAVIRQRVGQTPLCAVVKADAYGHGDLTVARTLARAGAAWFAVSCLQEALHLRRGGVEQPILILGYTAPAQAAQLARHHITQTLMSTDYAHALSAAAAQVGVTVDCHLKADTGMGRIGFSVRSDFAAALAAMEACFALPGLHISGLFQHFAVADSLTPDNTAYTQAQHALFASTAEALKAAGHPLETVHCCNSAGQMLHPEWGGNLVRAGIILYGCDPSGEVHFADLAPVMTLKTVVTHIKELEPGQSVSYGRTYTAAAPRRVATLAVGYADGYPRLLSGKGVVAIGGQPAPLVGRVCMDQCLVDVTDLPEVTLGTEVTVFGPGGAGDTVDDVAQKAGTINYEVLCGITRRVPRVYLEQGRVVQILNYLDCE